MQPQLLLDGRPSAHLYVGAAALRGEREEAQEHGSVGGHEPQHALRLRLGGGLEENSDQRTLRGENAERGPLRVSGIVQAHPGAERRRELSCHHAGIVSAAGSS